MLCNPTISSKPSYGHHKLLLEFTSRKYTMLPKSNAWSLLGLLIGFSIHAPCAEGGQTARPLPGYWFEDDDWHLEVQHIITAEELGKYRALRTVEDRDAFISEFWSRRNPTPSTPANVL